VLSWGRGNSGQLGHGEVLSNALFPKAVTSLDGYFITHVAAGWSHSGFVSGLFCSGCILTVFVKVEVTWFSVESGFFSFWFGLLGWFSDSGCVFTCGDGTFGQLGHGDYASQCSPVKLSCFVDQRVVQVACGMRHSLVLLEGIGLVLVGA